MKADADRVWECLVPTCRTIALQRQKLQGAGWDNEPHSVTERGFFADGWIIVCGGQSTRWLGKKADYTRRNRSPVAPKQYAIALRRRTPISHCGKVNEIIRKFGGANPAFVYVIIEQQVKIKNGGKEYAVDAIGIN